MGYHEIIFSEKFETIMYISMFLPFISQKTPRMKLSELQTATRGGLAP